MSYTYTRAPLEDIIVPSAATISLLTNNNGKAFLVGSQGIVLVSEIGS